MPANLENSAVATGLEKVSVHSNPKERQCQRILKLQHSCAHLTQESSRKTSISVLLTVSKPLTVWITINWKILKEMGIPNHLTCLLRNLYAGQEATVRAGHGTIDWFQKEKKYVEAVYCHPAYLTSMQSTS